VSSDCKTTSVNIFPQILKLVLFNINLMIYNPLVLCLLGKRGSKKLSNILLFFNQAKYEIILFSACLKESCSYGTSKALRLLHPFQNNNSVNKREDGVCLYNLHIFTCFIFAIFLFIEVE